MAQYLKQDSEKGYIVDNAEIEYTKFNNLRHVVLGCMLGDFDETGAYVVASNLIKELIDMPKFIVESMDNIEICQGELKLDKRISFMVTFEGNKASLSLIEKLNYEANFKLNSGTYSNIIETVLDEVETSGEINRNVLYQRWNIGAFGGNVIDVFNCDDSALAKYLGLVNRFKYLLEANKILLEKEEELEEVEANYSNEILNILKHYPKLEQAVIKQIKETLDSKKDAVSVTKPNFAKTFNEILDNAVQSNIDVLDEKDKKEFDVEKHNVVVNTNIKKDAVIDVDSVTSDNNLNPNLVKIKVDPNNSSKSITDLTGEFSDVNIKASQRLNNGNHTSEINQLEQILVTYGILNAIVKTPTVNNIETNNITVTTTVVNTNNNNTQQSGTGSGGGGSNNKKGKGAGSSGGSNNKKGKGAGSGGRTSNAGSKGLKAGVTDKKGQNLVIAAGKRRVYGVGMLVGGTINAEQQDVSNVANNAQSVEVDALAVLNQQKNGVGAENSQTDQYANLTTGTGQDVNANAVVSNTVEGATTGV